MADHHRPGEYSSQVTETEPVMPQVIHPLQDSHSLSRSAALIFSESLPPVPGRRTLDRSQVVVRDPQQAGVRGDMIPVKGALEVIGAGFCFALMSAGVKLVEPSQPNAVIVFFRNAFALLVLLPWALESGRTSLSTNVVRFHILRSVAGLAAMYCFFFAIGKLQLADAVLLNYTLPLFMPPIAAVWLKEPFGRRTAAALLLGFFGVALIIRPSGGVWEPAALIGLSSGFLSAIAQVTIRRLTFTEPALRVVVWFSLLSTSLSAVPLLWTPFRLTPRDALILAGTGMVAALAQWLLTMGYASAPAASVGPFIYSTVLFAVCIEWIVWNVTPGWNTILGAALIAAGGVSVLKWRNWRFLRGSS